MRRGSVITLADDTFDGFNGKAMLVTYPRPRWYHRLFRLAPPAPISRPVYLDVRPGKARMWVAR